ncbi:MAG: biopolymer transporter ExbD [Alcanivoracaceae bacterium]|jgi:biopolymer transport protein ExbD|nr:biopolymer transporter ExbD [Alcanivoracaceae bacterium]
MSRFSIPDDSRRRPDIEPVLPLINVVFLLLIFFMVAGQLAPGLPADVSPPESAAASADSDEPIRLVVDQHGNLFWQDEPMAIADMPDRLDGLRKDRPVQLLTDGSIPVVLLRPALEGLRNAGITEVLLVTRSLP